MLATLAVVWSVGIFLAGVVEPLFDSTTISGPDWEGALILGLPAAASLCVWWLLHRYCREGERLDLRLAWLAITACIPTVFGAGPYTLVAIWFMASAAAFTRPRYRSPGVA